MFISVTRFGAMRSLRLATQAIAYLDLSEYGAVIKMIGGESLHVEETVAEIEAMLEARWGCVTAVQIGDRRVEYDALYVPEQQPAAAGEVPIELLKPGAAIAAKPAAPKAKRK